jgi:hypothetical protein
MIRKAEKELLIALLLICFLAYLGSMESMKAQIKEPECTHDIAPKHWWELHDYISGCNGTFNEQKDCLFTL